MSKRNNWEDFKKILEQHHITTLYHFLTLTFSDATFVTC